MIDDKVVDILHGDSGSFCHYCDVLKKEVSSLEFIDNAGVGRMPVSKTIEQCKECREWLESRQISYSDPQRKGQCHPPLSSQSDYLLAILHQELQYLDFILKILYNLMCGIKIWNEASPSVKVKVSKDKV